MHESAKNRARRPTRVAIPREIIVAWLRRVCNAGCAKDFEYETAPRQIDAAELRSPLPLGAAAQPTRRLEFLRWTLRQGVPGFRSSWAGLTPRDCSALGRGKPCDAGTGEQPRGYPEAERRERENRLFCPNRAGIWGFRSKSKGKKIGPGMSFGLCRVAHPSNHGSAEPVLP
jgi:hypothetical protein